MSRVFLAHETALGRPVVVKVLMPTLAAGVSVDRFRREILLVAKLQHPHIVPVYSAGEAAGLPYFTMPFVEGESLRERIAHHGELPIPEVIRLLRNVASALSYAHGQGVIHRDIKPDNVLLSMGSAIVADFGVAKAISDSATGETSRITSLGMALGTPAYMAPEQAAGDPALDHRVDIYSFGILAYEMITGRPPFTGRSPQALLAAQVTEIPLPIQNLRPSVPPMLGTLVMRCLEKHAADRPSVADELLHSLDTLTTPSGGSIPTTQVRTAPRSGGEPVTSGARGSPWTKLVVVAAGILVLGALYLGVGNRGRNAGNPSGMEATRLSGTPFGDSVPADLPAGSGAGIAAASPASDSPEPGQAERSPPPRQPTGPAPGPGRTQAAAPVAAAVAPARQDSTVMVQLRNAALESRREAASRGVGAAGIARGESLFARGDSLRRQGLPGAASMAYSSASAAWSAALPEPAPRPVQPADAEPPTPRPAPVRAEDPRPAIARVVAAYAAAIESRSLTNIRQVYPGMSSEQEAGWRQFFDSVREVDVRLEISALQLSGDSAECTLSGLYVFENATTRRTEQQPASIRMTLGRSAAGDWGVLNIR